MGALTFKPSAHGFRPWEVFQMPAPDYFDYQSGLTLVVRGARVVKVVGTGWLRDRVRFCYDGFRRQRLIQPYAKSGRLGWSDGVGRWWTYLAYSRINLVAGPDYPGWVAAAVRRVAHFGGAPVCYVYDLGRTGTLFHGPFGLPGASALALPAQLNYEEGLFVAAPMGVPSAVAFIAAALQVVGPPKQGAYFGSLPLVTVLQAQAGRRVSRSVLQVSPVQRLFDGATC